jgi:small subunit ribosomal protein S16
MATKIRLQRFGKKGKPFFHVVVADSRSPRDGKFIERLGSYNPNTNPATIEINFEKTLDWVNKGAEPTDTARAILSYKGVLYMKHLQGGVKKGALTEDQADAKFATWLEAKGGKIEGKKENLSASKGDVKKAALAAETKKNADRGAAIALKNAPVEEVVVEEEVVADEAPAAEATTEDVVAETPVVEEAAAVVEETPAVEETVAVAENAPVADETPAAEASTEEKKEEA